jgi:microcystin degradation protein MlrC
VSRAGPCIAVARFAVECNRFAPPLSKADFEADTFCFGSDWAETWRPQPPAGELAGFVAAMDAAGPWTPCALGAALAHPNGPVPDALFAAVQQRLIAELRQARARAGVGGVEGVVLMLHGAAITPSDPEPEATLAEAVRAEVGPGVPLVVVLDLHANLSPRLLSVADALVPYRSNPHVDQAACGAEAARLLRRLLAGERWARVLLRLPLVASTITMRTAPGSGPFADMTEAAARLQAAGDAVVAAVLGSFPHSDTPSIGLAVLVQGPHADAATRQARAIAALGWQQRAAFDPPLCPPDEAVARTLRHLAEPAPPLLALADLGDNPGGGAAARDLELLRALHRAGVPQHGRVLAGLLHDPDAVQATHRAGVGAALPAPGGLHPAARVQALSDGRCTGRRGLLAGAALNLGPCAALAFDGIVLVLSSHRFSPNDPVCFEHLGLDLRHFRVLVLKSRGHFRAGFDEFVGDDQVLEVATPGVTSPDLRRLAWQHRPRPVWPLDGDVAWNPETAMPYRAGP